MTRMNKIKMKDVPVTYKSAVGKSLEFVIDKATGVLKKDETVCKLSFNRSQIH